MDAATRREIEDLKDLIKKYDAEEIQIEKDLQQLKKYRKDAMDRLKLLSNDEQYQKDMLTLVYEQRNKKK